jgi:hypothetical protein
MTTLRRKPNVMDKSHEWFQSATKIAIELASFQSSDRKAHEARLIERLGPRGPTGRIEWCPQALSNCRVLKYLWL